MKPSEKPKVSVIIPTNNSGQTLKRCLQSIKNQTYTNYEIIIIDNFSNDETPNIAKNFEAKVLMYKCNPAKARNIGVEYSEGDYVLFIDSDQFLSPHVMDECVDICVKEKAEMVRIPEIFVGKGFWSKCSAIWKNHYEQVENLYVGNKSLIHGEPRFFLKRKIREVGLFNIKLIWGEDYDLYERMKSHNTREAYCKSVLYHEENDTPKKYLLRNIRYGQSMPIFKQQTKKQIFPSLLNHAFFTFLQILKEPQFPTIVVGCTLLLWIKSSSIIIGALRSF